ncbi:MAG: amino acid ABC transporter substrate-binding protein [Alphaproteobacteria bacterium]|nr:amino acid ABC transporter substrate-binding protein [Alphaproteobacteria bacterium]
MTISRRRVLVGSAGGATLAIAGFPAILRAQTQRRPLVFGGSVPMTGAAAETGLNVLNGYQAAVKRINEDLGGLQVAGTTYQLEVRMFDDASDPQRATTLIQRQVDENIGLFLGSFGSNIVLPTCAITERARRPMVQAGGGSDQIFTQGRRFVFGIFPRATRQFDTSVAFFKRLQPAVATTMIVYTNDPFSRFQAEGAKKAIEEAGMRVLDSIALPAQVSDVSAVLASVRQHNPDILICNTHDENSLLIARQMISSNTNTKLLYQSLGPQTAAYREALGRYANGVVTQTYWDENAAYQCPYFGNAKGFAEYYRKNFQRPMTYHMASAAACIVAYAQAMKNANSIEPARVRDALAAMDFPCFYGRVKFAAQGDGDAQLLGPLVAQVQNGQLAVVHPEAGATGRPVYPVAPWAQRG